MATPMKTCQNVIAVSIKRQIGFGKVPAVYIGPLRCLSSVQPSDHDHVNPPGRLKKYVVDRFMRYVDHYESKLGRRYPKVYKVYKVFTGGMKDFLSDAHCYYNVSTSLWAGQSLGEFSRKELETYRQAPRDLVKMAPMLLVTALPLVPYVIFPVAYFFPRYFLTSHFWTPEQRTNFALLSHKHRLQHFPPILDYLHNQCRYLDEADRQSLRAQLKKIEKGLTVEEMLDLKRYFETFPYQLQRISIAHVRHLARSLGMSLRRSRLIDEAALLRHIDAAMAREGVEKLTDRELETACFWRGLNPVGMSRVERLAYIRQWLSVSAHTDDETVSLLLHSPVLLAYYQPTNKIFMSKRLSWRAKR